MKEGYIPKDQRKTILILSDDIRTQSGVGNMAKEIVLNSAHHFNWVNLGGAVKHPEAGKGFDVSPDINKITGLTDSSVKVIPPSAHHQVVPSDQVPNGHLPHDGACLRGRAVRLHS